MTNAEFEWLEWLSLNVEIELRDAGRGVSAEILRQRRLRVQSERARPVVERTFEGAAR